MQAAGSQPIALSPEQQAAVERTGQDVCVVAGPGSGKTRVLVERFAWLVEQGADPEKILAITFTEKAATELKDRLAKRFARRDDLRRKIERAQISTIHGFCHAILREHALAAGLDPRFEVLDDVEAAALRREVMLRVLDEAARERPREFLRLAEVWPANEMAAALLSVHEAMRAAGKLEEALRPLEDAGAFEQCLEQLRTHLDSAIQAAGQPKTEARRNRLEQVRALRAGLAAIPPADLPSRVCNIKLTGAEDPVKEALHAARNAAEACVHSWAAREFRPQRDLLIEILARFGQQSSEQRRRRAAADFSDLEEFTLRLLGSDDAIRKSVQDRFEHILMDELQDTNPVQWQILSLVRRPQRFFGVGDVNQSIYAFRHAEPRLFRDYEDEISSQGWTIDRLFTNYRTRPEILDAVARILVRRPEVGIAPHELRAGAAFPPAAHPCVELICGVKERDADETPRTAMWLAARLRELYGTPLASENRPARFGDMAVFVRNSGSFDALEQALQRFSIPYVVTGGKTYFDAMEVVDLLNLVRVIACKEDSIALFAVLRSPLFGVSDEQLLKRKVGRLLATSEEEQILSALRSLHGPLPLSAVLAQFLDESGYAARLEAAERANVEKFFSLLDSIEARVGRDPVAVLERIEALRAAAEEANAPGLEAGDAVQLMTIHKSKGLEFPIVAIAAMEKGDKNRDEAALYHPDCGLGFRWLLDNGEKVEDPIMKDALSRLKEKSAEELNRLLYVAMTRAKERLILSFTRGKRMRSPWPGLVLQGLELAMPSEPHQPAQNGLAIITRIDGAPEVPPAPELGAAAPPDEFVRLEPLREAPSEVSITALAAFEQCPRRYLLQSSLRWPLPPTAGAGALDLGTEVHELLAGLRAEASDEARQLARVFESSDLARRAAAARESRREMDFLVELDGTLLRGQIDLWFDEGQGPVLVDYKTDQYLSEDRQRGYELQLRLYALALEKLHGRPVREAWLFPLREGRPHSVSVSPTALAAALERLRQWRKAEEAGEFPPLESPGCQWCPFAAGPCPVNPARRPGL